MIYQEYQPSLALRGIIRSMHYMRSKGIDDFPFTGIIVPDGYAELYIFNGPSFAVQMNDQVRPLSSTFLAGMCKETVQYVPSGAFECWSIKFQPWALAPLLHIAQHELVDLYVEGEQLWNGGQLSKLQQLWSAPSPASAVTFLEKFIAGLIDDLPTGLQRSEWGVREIIARQGVLTISALCKQQGISRQYLERLFKTYVGLTPSEFARVFRIRKITTLVQQEKFQSYTQLAYQFNYSDQAHFIHDFKKVTGTPPRQFFSNKHFILSM